MAADSVGSTDGAAEEVPAEIQALVARLNAEEFQEVLRIAAAGGQLPQHIHKILAAVDRFEIVREPDGRDVLSAGYAVSIVEQAQWVRLIFDINGRRVWKLTDSGKDVLRRSNKAAFQAAINKRPYSKASRTVARKATRWRWHCGALAVAAVAGVLLAALLIGLAAVVNELTDLVLR